MDQSNFSIKKDDTKVDDICKIEWYLSTFQTENLNFVDTDRTQIYRVSRAGKMSANPFEIHYQNLILVYTSLSNIKLSKFLTSVVNYPWKMEILDFDLGILIDQTSNTNEPDSISEEEIFIRENGWLKKIMINNINWIKVEGVYTHLACKEGLHTLRNTAKCVLHKLPKGLFYQIHKCYYVNRKKVEAINANSVKIGDNILPIGRTYHKTILQEIAHIK